MSVLVIDFGSQVTQLIARRVREAGVYCEIVPYNKAPQHLENQHPGKKPRAIILSGGPASAYEEGSPRAPQAVFDELPKGVSTPELKVAMAEGTHYTFIGRFKEKASFPGARVSTIDGVRADYPDGWGLVRCSNTTPSLVLRFDANDGKALERIKDTFRAQILALDPELKLPF